MTCGPVRCIIPVCEDPADEDKPGWIVDGQQRSAAIRDARIDSFPVCVTAFITDSDEEQRSQFILVNSAKPLPKGLIYELLPATVGTLPLTLQARKFPAILLRRLNCEIRSPLYRKIRTPTTAGRNHQRQLDTEDAGKQPQRRRAVQFPRPADRHGR